MHGSLVIAHAALWVLIAGVGLLVWVLARQVSALYARVAPAGALAVNAVLELGGRAPAVPLATLDGRPIDLGGSGRSRLLLFVSPECPISRSLLPVLRTLPDAEPWLDVVLVSDGDDRHGHEAFAREAGLDYACSESLGRACGVSKLPYAVLIDEAGLVTGFGIVNSREHLESLFEAKERGIPSIQAFMAASDRFSPAD